MKKKYMPNQVRDGEIRYTFDVFLKELWKDVETTLSQEYPKKTLNKSSKNGFNKKTLRDVFVFVYRICYLAAMNNMELKRLLERIDSESKGVVKKTLESNKENIALLHAIFMREISIKLEQGLTKRQAVKATIEESKRAFRAWNG